MACGFLYIKCVILLVDKAIPPKILQIKSNHVYAHNSRAASVLARDGYCKLVHKDIFVKSFIKCMDKHKIAVHDGELIRVLPNTTLHTRINFIVYCTTSLPMRVTNAIDSSLC